MSNVDPTSNRTYDLLLALEDLESLREEMEELGVARAAELEGRPEPAAVALLADLRAQGLDSLAAVTARIDELHRRLDTREGP